MTIVSRVSPVMRVSVLALAASLAGCASEHYRRGDGVTDAVGDSVAANTALQIVDPWPAGVDDPNIDSPYERPEGFDDDGGDKPVSQPDTPAPNP